METKNTKTEETTTHKGKVISGVVVSTKMQDTISVKVDRYVMHPKYKKYQKRSKKFLVHDEGNTAKEGDKVDIQETTPISKRKRFTLVK